MVATVTPINDAKSKAGYFLTEGYYAKDSAEHRNASSWFGKAAALLKLGRTVAPTVFERVLNGDLEGLVKEPGTGKRLGRFRNKKFEHRPGIEITLSAPKSVSIEGLVFDNKGVIKAHDEAVRRTLALVERELLVTRVYNRETKRMDRVPAGGMVAACFRHLASPLRRSAAAHARAGRERDPWTRRHLAQPGHGAPARAEASDRRVLQKRTRQGPVGAWVRARPVDDRARTRIRDPRLHPRVDRGFFESAQGHPGIPARE